MISVQEGGTWSSNEAKVDIALKTVAVALWPWRELCSETITWLVGMCVLVKRVCA